MLMTRSSEFIKTAAQISDAVDNGASPADPSVIALLNSVASAFKPAFTLGNDRANILSSRGDTLNYVNGLGGNDIIRGSNKTDVLVGGEGNDILSGLAGDDGLFGGNGNDILNGGTGNDELRGGSGNDILRGDTGNDKLNGGMGNDVLNGGSGNDELNGSVGNDVLIGGSGADRFFFNPNQKGEGDDSISDFQLGTDKIVLSVANVLASTPDLLSLTGNPNGFEPTDLDASPLWNLGASKDGDLVIHHPNGSIELNGITFSPALTFGSIIGAIELV
jgi:Ca2+-binding RTX toxin-like protein